MTPKEATARIKINQLLEQAGWRFADTPAGHANVVLENYAKLSESDEGLTKTRPGFIDYLLLDNRGFPLAVLEAKRPGKNPLTGKEQARHYAQSQRCRFVILPNGETHYLWDVEAGQPVKVATLPSLMDLVGGKQRFLFEMATGTGKTLTAAAIMQLFLRTGQARRVLFLVDRLELYALLNTHPSGKVLKQVFGKLSGELKGSVVEYVNKGGRTRD